MVFCCKVSLDLVLFSVLRSLLGMFPCLLRSFLDLVYSCNKMSMMLTSTLNFNVDNFRYPGLTASEELPSGCKIDWNYWGTGHGKGPHDGAGACVKQALRREQVKEDSVKLHNATNVVNFLRVDMNLPHAAYPSARQHVVRHFHLIGITDVV